ncbi:response regulator transcription factor [Paradevosia shaoguanensis]|uniref:Response regulator transcription factor n=1 Tax=Paradevosia shaoguanensis TaxID=1335043 RepID=A0AA41QLQ6_9HYPH|nr:response regulator transcription factor [Paradevosia shaoguanensis]KFL26273.1 transcriptional regulator [Devosia sp. 17-2-E-8]MCF1742709.1 response regulator transcription factor [Paradevosia shaoguanensis]MCI0127192.1 response regulator transcription factor [Paradevosia shaoguanensis]QMV01928.1 response regulator [Devosia sp. D6-9]
MKILVGEDDTRIAEVLASSLGRSGFEVHRESDGETIWFRADTEDFDAIILDLGLPQMDGLTVLKRWRQAGVLTPVLILTARGQWEERVEGIEAGADDYVVKPFHALEIVARMRALIRRSKGMASSRIPFGKYEMDMRTMQVTEDGNPIDLTPQEFRLMAYLLHNRGRVVSQLEITEHIYRQDFERESNAVEVLVARLRKRLGRDVVKTRRGFGYMLGADY